MKVLHSWLAEYVPGLLSHEVGADPQALAEALSSLGLECDGVTEVGGGLDGVVVARVRSLTAHPEADRIQLVHVEDGTAGAGDSEPLQVCCGAFNMAVGDLVPLATVGTTMANGMEIARRKLRGEWSNGMLCSAQELGLGDDHSGIMILPADLEPGRPVGEALGIVADTVFDIDLTPNRPDAFSVIGVARDLASKLGLEFVLPDLDVPTAGTDASDVVSVRIEDPDLCGRFTAVVLSGVQVGESPRWMQQRLTWCGMRPINSVVDVSNYVMLEYGQPNHTYDLSKVAGASLGVRRAAPGERLVTLDDKERNLVETDGIIVDGDDVAIGIAGVMGGASTEIDQHTETVVLELAWFDPRSVSSTSKRHGLRSEASSRFEKGVDPEVAARAARRFAQLLCDQGAQLHPGSVVARGHLAPPTEVKVRVGRVNAVLGTDLTQEQIVAYANSVGFTHSELEPGVVSVTVPSWRPDATGEIDVIEEVARLHGYEQIGRTVPRSPKGGGLTSRQLDIRRIRGFLAAYGASEATPMGFLAPGDLEACGVRPHGVKVANPLVAEESILRTSLLPGLIKTLGYNATHRNVSLALFEVGHCFETAPDGGIPREWEEVAVVLGGSDAGAATRLALQVTELLGVDAQVGSLETNHEHHELLGGLHPGRRCVIMASGHPIGVAGEVDPAVTARYGIAERVGFVSFVLGGDQPWHGGVGLLSVPRSDRQFRPISRMPSADFDVALIVDDAVPVNAVVSTLLEAGEGLAVSAELFDVYRGPSIGDSRRSLAVRIRCQAPDRTLTDAELAQCRERMVAVAAERHGAELRT